MLKLALIGVLVPSVISALILLLGRWWALRQGEDRFDRWRSALLCGALSCAYLVTHGLLVGWPELPFLEIPAASLDAKHWVFYSVFLAFLLGAPAEALAPRPRLIGRWLVRVLVLVVLLTGTLYSQVKWNWETDKSVAMFAGLSLGGLFHYGAWDFLWARRPGPGQPFLFLLLGSSLSVTLMIAGSASLAQLVGVLTSAAGAVWVLTLLGWQKGFAEGASTILGTALMGLVLNGHIFVSLPGMDSMLFMLAGYGAFLLFLPRLRDRYVKTGFLGATMLVAALAGSCLHLAHERQLEAARLEVEEKKDYEGEGYVDEDGEERHWDGF